jgi:hypothetical protein
MLDEVAAGAERLSRMEAAIVNAWRKRNREIVQNFADSVFVFAADRSGWTRNQRSHCLALRRRGLRLDSDEGVVILFAESGRRELPAGIAVNATGVYIELAGGVRRDSLPNICHAFRIAPRRRA